jgi:hypothetical protein
MRLALSKSPNRVGVSFSSPKGGNKYIFRNSSCSNYIEFLSMDKVQEPSDSEYR